MSLFSLAWMMSCVDEKEDNTYERTIKYLRASLLRISPHLSSFSSSGIGERKNDYEKFRFSLGFFAFRVDVDLSLFLLSSYSSFLVYALMRWSVEVHHSVSQRLKQLQLSFSRY